MKSLPILQKFLTFSSDIINNYSHPNILTKTINSILLNNQIRTLHLTKLLFVKVPFTEAECLNALNTMKKEKTPGGDGLPAEFYQTFWSILGCDLVQVFNSCYDSGTRNDSVYFHCCTRKEMRQTLTTGDQYRFFVQITKSFLKLQPIACYQLSAMSSIQIKRAVYKEELLERMSPSFEILLDTAQLVSEFTRNNHFFGSKQGV